MTLKQKIKCAIAGLALLGLAACGSSRSDEAAAAPMPTPVAPMTQIGPVPAAAVQPQPTQPAMQQTYQPAAAVYRLGSGDNLRVTVFGEDSITGDYKVEGTGMISLPLIGNVMAGGLTVQELQDSIAQHLSQGFLLNPRVSVQVMNYRPFFILGEVNRPNQYAYVEGMKVINAVAMAGGFSYRADEDSMKIIRAADPTRSKQPAEPNTYVLPGDTIEVQERLF